jgi:hypothetical protein
MVTKTDGDWAGCLDTVVLHLPSLSTSVATSSLGPPSGNTYMVSRSSVEAEYRVVANDVQHQCTKHIKIDLHFIRYHVAMRQFQVLHVPSSRQCADIMMKGLPSTLFLDFRSSLNVRPPPVVTPRQC